MVTLSTRDSIIDDSNDFCDYSLFDICGIKKFLRTIGECWSLWFGIAKFRCGGKSGVAGVGDVGEKEAEEGEFLGAT